MLCQKIGTLKIHRRLFINNSFKEYPVDGCSVATLIVSAERCITCLLYTSYTLRYSPCPTPPRFGRCNHSRLPFEHVIVIDTASVLVWDLYGFWKMVVVEIGLVQCCTVLPNLSSMERSDNVAGMAVCLRTAIPLETWLRWAMPYLISPSWCWYAYPSLEWTYSPLLSYKYRSFVFALLWV